MVTIRPSALSKSSGIHHVLTDEVFHHRQLRAPNLANAPTGFLSWPHFDGVLTLSRECPDRKHHSLLPSTGRGTSLSVGPHALAIRRQRSRHYLACYTSRYSVRVLEASLETEMCQNLQRSLRTIRSLSPASIRAQDRSPLDSGPGASPFLSTRACCLTAPFSRAL